MCSDPSLCCHVCPSLLPCLVCSRYPGPSGQLWTCIFGAALAEAAASVCTCVRSSLLAKKAVLLFTNVCDDSSATSVAESSLLDLQIDGCLHGLSPTLLSSTTRQRQMTNGHSKAQTDQCQRSTIHDSDREEWQGSDGQQNTGSYDMSVCFATACDRSETRARR